MRFLIKKQFIDKSGILALVLYEVYLTLTSRTLSCLGFLKIYRNKRAQQREFLDIFPLFYGLDGFRFQIL